MDRISPGGAEEAQVGRRAILRIGALGGAAGLIALPRHAGTTSAAGATEAMLLSCMDYRLLHEIDQYMLGRGLRNKYDQVILAGASLATLTDKYPARAQTFWEHLEVSIQLHRIHEVIVMDHRDCGAYKILLGEDLSKDRAKETVVHAEKLRELRKRIKAKHPRLAVELLLMNLDGTVDKIA